MNALFVTAALCLPLSTFKCDLNDPVIHWEIEQLVKMAQTVDPTYELIVRADRKVVYKAEHVIIEWRGHQLWVRRSA